MKKIALTLLLLLCTAFAFAQKTSRPQPPDYDSLKWVYKEKIGAKKDALDSFLSMEETLLSDSAAQPMSEREFISQRLQYSKDIVALKRARSLAIKNARDDYEKNATAYDARQPYYKYKQRARVYRSASLISGGLSLAFFVGNISYTIMEGGPDRNLTPEQFRCERNTQIGIAITSAALGATSICLGKLSSANKRKFKTAISLAAHTDWLPNNTVLPSFGFAINF